MKQYDSDYVESGGGKPSEELVNKAVGAIMEKMQERFDEEQKKPFQYVVAYYDKDNNLLGYHADSFCNLTQTKEKGKRYNGDNPYKQLETIRKNLDFTLEVTEEESKKGLFSGLSYITKKNHFPTFGKDDVFIEAEYLDEGIPPQRFVWKQVNTEDNG